MNTALPDGWTIERVRLASGDDEAELLAPDRHVTVTWYGRSAPEVLHPDVILSFTGICLAHAAGEWFMGELQPDGSLVCWSSYGTDLAEAIRGL
ncbi:hypothetical protein [Streptomyces sp. NRRL WC-3742]|uniref:hypothetical protein n=1 Tax=Streptomyces sp. NRRL WC-3742 TaxID=1463934 RepID=UPI00069024FA|nr:hypothetical protein [Streptomyces sp. NRRL WC-3742]